MNHAIRAQVSDPFRDVIQDWTPASERHHARVVYAPVLFDPDASHRCSIGLSDSERNRAEAFLTPEHKNHFVQRRAFRRFCAAIALREIGTSPGQIVFEETDKGRPFIRHLPWISFSFASCRSGFIGAWSTKFAVGVDIEDQLQNWETIELAEHYFSEKEARVVRNSSGVERVPTFVRLWCLKEAALKSIGEGLPFGLDAFHFDLSSTPQVETAPAEYGGPSRFNTHLIERNDTCAALVTYAK